MNTHVHDLKNTGIHPSYQRVRILEFLRSCSAEDFFPDKSPEAYLEPTKIRDYHPTAEQVHSCLAKDIPTLSKTTVYNTLKLFEERKLVSSVMSDQHGALRYDRYAHEHAHLLCNTCGELIDWEIPEALEVQLSASINEASKLNSWQLILRGTCPACR